MRGRERTRLQVSVCAMTGLTYNLDVDVSAVHHVLNLNGQRVLPGVGSLCGADEEDGVHLTGTSSHRLVLQRSAVPVPGHDGAGLTLQTVDTRSEREGGGN